MEENSKSKNHFDLIVLGTGLTESLVACAATKIGKSVLHLDTNDFYGGDNCTFSLDEYVSESLRLFKLQKGECPHSQIVNWHISDIWGGSDASIEGLKGNIIDCRYGRSSVSSPVCKSYLLEKNMTDDQWRNSENTHPVFMNYSLDKKCHSLGKALHMSRNYNIDSMCNLIYCSGDAVDLMIKSGVDNYLEFNIIEHVYYYNSFQSQDASITSLQQWVVPCSKADIFSTALLPNASKRYLMKFLQFTADWGRTNIDGIANVHNLNEIELGLGRSLHRPQNKQAQTNVANSENDALRLHRTSFVDFMRSKPHNLPDDLQDIIYYALCLQCDPIPATGAVSAMSENVQFSAYHGLKMLYNHIKSLDRFSSTGNGKTAFLYPIYGIGELAQAFCRMCAVWGGIYMLRIPVLKCGISPGACEAASSPPVVSVTTEEETFTATNIVCHYQNRGLYKLCETTGVEVGVNCAAAGENAIVSSTSSYLVFRTSVMVGTLLTAPESSPGGCHCIGILPPNTVKLPIAVGDDVANTIVYNHPFAIHIVQLASKASVCPDDNMVLYFSSTIDCKFYCENREALGSGPLNTEKNYISYVSKLLMNTVMDTFKDLHISNSNTNSVTELFYATRVKRIVSTNTCCSENGNVEGGCDAVLYCGLDHKQCIDVNNYFIEAKSLFSNLFPGEIFMKSTEDVAEEAEFVVEKTADENLEAPSTTQEQGVAESAILSSSNPPAVEDEDMEFLLATLKSVT